MGLYNFQRGFVPFVEDGTKRHTIRAPRRRKIDQPGDLMHLYFGLRTSGASLIFRAPCRLVEAITLWDAAIAVNGGYLSPLQRDCLAWRDGFRPPGTTAYDPGPAFALMRRFWAGKFPFSGFIFHWDYGKRINHAERN